MRKPVTLSIVAITCLIALLATDQMAFAQAGSIGGTIGKTDKSASGGEGQPHSRAKPQKDKTDATRAIRSSSCRDIVGTWKWYLGLSETTFLADGSARHSAGATGKWQCVGSAISAVWSNGVKEHYVLSPDGNSLSVDTSWNGGAAFVVTRESH